MDFGNNYEDDSMPEDEHNEYIREEEAEASEMEIDHDIGSRPKHAYLNPFDSNDPHSMYIYADDIKESSESRERRHAATSVLGDQELLMFHAVANNESIPQTRHRFLHHLIGIPPPTTRRYAVRNLTESPQVQPSSSSASASRHPSRIPTNIPDLIAGCPVPGSYNNTPRSRPSAPASKSKSNGGASVIDVIEVNGGWENWDWYSDPSKGRGNKGHGPGAGSGPDPGPSSKLRGKGKGRS